MKKFIEFALIWYSQQFAIPFWIVGHVHLHFNNYHQLIEFGSSVIMHIFVLLGFWFDWINYKKQYGNSND